jgi:glyoxylase-like metal-dependent hydrolase (beta-lactamase superfamily II)
MVMRSSVACLILVCTSLRAQAPVSPHFALSKLADGVYAAIASDTGFAVSNSGIIDLGQGLLIFDSFISPQAAADLRNAAVALTGKPVLYVVDSHFHNDHIRGNQEFSGAHIISTILTRGLIEKEEPEEIAWEKANIAARLRAAQDSLAAERKSDRRAEDRFWVRYYEAIKESQGTLRTVLPDLTFEGRLLLEGPLRSAELLDMGRGHTESDLILYLPAEKIVFMGDLLFIHRHPYLPDGYPANWVHTLERALKLDIRLAVPGHGPVGIVTDIKIMAGYITAVGNLATELAGRGATDQEIASQPVPAAYQAWWYSRFFGPNLKFMVEAVKERQPNR